MTEYPRDPRFGSALMDSLRALQQSVSDTVADYKPSSDVVDDQETVQHPDGVTVGGPEGAVTLEAMAPPAPDMPEVTLVEANGLVFADVSWGVDQDEPGFADIAGYEVLVLTAGDTVASSFPAVTGSPVQVGPLAPSMDHTIWVVSFNRIELRSEPSPSVVVTAPAVTPPSDGLPPGSSPTPSTLGGLGLIFVRWPAVINADPVTYEVHISTTSGFTPSSSTLVTTTDATLVAVKQLADGTPLVYDTDYFFRIVARDVDDSAAPSGEVSGRMDQAAQGDIAAGSVTAEHLAAVLLMASRITTGSVDENTGQIVGRRIDIDPTGLFLIDQAGNPLIELPTDPTLPAVFRGDAEIDHLTVRLFTTLQQSALAQGAVLTLENSVSAPTNPPSVTVEWETTQFANPPGTSWGDRRAWTADGVETLTARVSGTDCVVERWASSGGRLAVSAKVAGVPAGITVAGSWVLVLAQRGSSWVVLRFDKATLEYKSFAVWSGADGSRSPALGYDAVAGRVMVAQSRAADDKVRIQRFTHAVDAGPGGTVVSSFASPGGYPTGLAWDGTNLWHADWHTRRIYKMTTGGAVVSSFTAPGSEPNGLAWDGTNLWCADGLNNTIYKLTTTGAVVSSFYTPGGNPTGLAWDGTYLWHADVFTDTIYKLTTAGAVVSSFPSPGSDPYDLAWDGTHLWCADEGNSTIYKLTTAGVVVSSFASPDALPTGLTWDGTHLWCSDSGTDRIYKLTTSSDTLTPTTAVATAFTYPHDLAGVLYGTFDLGANRYIFSSTGNHYFRSIDTTGADQVNETWAPAAGTKIGLLWDGTNFYSMDASGRRAKYEAGAGNRWTSGSSTWHAAYTWRDSTTLTETTRSPVATFTMHKRARIKVTTAALVSGVNQARVYLAKGTAPGAAPSMTLQAAATGTPPTLNILNAVFTPLNDPATNGFGTGTPAIARSQATDVAGPLHELKGDGTGRLSLTDLRVGTAGTRVKYRRIVTVTFDPPSVGAGTSANWDITLPAGTLPTPAKTEVVYIRGLPPAGPLVPIRMFTSVVDTINIAVRNTNASAAFDPTSAPYVFELIEYA